MTMMSVAVANHHYDIYVEEKLIKMQAARIIIILLTEIFEIGSKKNFT